MERENGTIDRDIQEYFLWVALEDIFQLAETNESSFVEHVRLSLHLVNSFPTIAACSPSDPENDAHLDFRRQLIHTALYVFPQVLQIVDLDVNQLESQREKQRTRSLHFLSHYNVFDGLPLPAFPVVETGLKSQSLPTLLDALPHFISLSATFFHLQKTQASPQWFTLAADLMAAASLQHLRDDEHRLDALAVAFSYGFSSAYLETCDDNQEVSIASLFWNEQTGTENPVWIHTRTDAIKRLLSESGTYFASHLEDLDAGPQYSRNTIFRGMRDMMKAFSGALPVPLLSCIDNQYKPT